MSSTVTEKVRSRVEEGIAIVTIDNPPVNAINSIVLEELDKIFETLRGDEIKGVVITGSGTGAFSAGADIKAFSADPGKAIEMIESGQKVFSKISNFEKPVVAAINGVALGGGNELAMACDIRISSDRARYSQPEVNLGLIPGWGGTKRLSILVGIAKAKEMIFTGQIISAQEALRIGLVNRVVPDGEELRAAMDLVRQIASRAAPLAVRAAKRVILKEMERSSVEDALRLEVEAIEELGKTDDLREGLEAFLRKRAPKFQGR